ncbi:hypothetical protein CFK37_03400 [Virgibacillus phasianinus]|uniref:Zinc ribbon domain-containing protein n=1 Tax=Virgibacillus phasianinus TaxID=2017483 RepID=A0A220U097_9BACI|nr:zinc ribbon domain-containing protein [Virgibacillus phasianinus]ASK61291.1 hypothetical protein CFK37_03400 [Virgibacillus phasianinus]
MQCPNCYQQTEQGKFCTNCGALISHNESAVTEESNELPAVVEQPNIDHSTSDEPNQSNDAMEKIKQSSVNFGHFFLTLVKKPNDAKKANGNDLVSGIISIVLYSLLFALGYYLIADSFLTMFMGNIGSPFGGPALQSLPFTNGFLWPFLKFIVLFAVIIALTFIGLKLTAINYSFYATCAKYGAYLIPFLLLLAVGYILTTISLYSIGIIAIMVSVLGAIIIIPTLILLEKPATGADRIYLLLLIYILNILACAIIMQSILTSIIPLMNPMGGMLD